MESGKLLDDKLKKFWPHMGESNVSTYNLYKKFTAKYINYDEWLQENEGT